MATVVLRTGSVMPLVGLGTWKAPADQTRDAVVTAVNAGYRLIDCANDYDNEHEVGKAIKKLLDDGMVKREELFVQVVCKYIQVCIPRCNQIIVKRQKSGTPTTAVITSAPTSWPPSKTSASTIWTRS